MVPLWPSQLQNGHQIVAVLIDVVALEASDVEIDTWLADGTVDLGGGGSYARLQDCEFPLGRDDWVAVVPAGHAIATSRVRDISLSQLANEPFVLATGGCTHHARSLAEDLGFELTDIRVKVRDWASSYALFREGLGVTVVPESTLPGDLRGLRALPFTDNLHRYFGLKSSEQTSGTPLAVTCLEVASSLACSTEDW